MNTWIKILLAILITALPTIYDLLQNDQLTWKSGISVIILAVIMLVRKFNKDNGTSTDN